MNRFKDCTEIAKRASEVQDASLAAQEDPMVLICSLAEGVQALALRVAALENRASSYEVDPEDAL